VTELLSHIGIAAVLVAVAAELVRLELLVHELGRRIRDQVAAGADGPATNF